MDWLKIGSAVLIVAMMIYIWPAAKTMLHDRPDAEKGDWQAAILPIAAVVGFVLLLMWLV